MQRCIFYVITPKILYFPAYLNTAVILRNLLAYDESDIYQKTTRPGEETQLFENLVQITRHLGDILELKLGGTATKLVPDEVKRVCECLKGTWVHYN